MRTPRWLRWLLSLEMLPPQLDTAAKQLTAPKLKDDMPGHNWSRFQTWDVEQKALFSLHCYFKKGATLPETSIATENQWLEDEISFWDDIFQGRAVSFTECSWKFAALVRDTRVLWNIYCICVYISFHSRWFRDVKTSAFQPPRKALNHRSKQNNYEILGDTIKHPLLCRVLRGILKNHDDGDPYEPTCKPFSGDIGSMLLDYEKLAYHFGNLY